MQTRSGDENSVCLSFRLSDCLSVKRVNCDNKKLSYRRETALQLLHQMFNLFALLWDDPLEPATPLTNGAIDETLQ